MNLRTGLLLLLCTASLPLFAATVDGPGPSPRLADASRLASEKRLVSRGYETLALYNRAAQLRQYGIEGAALGESLALRFTLSSFREGRVDELLDVRFSTLATPVSGLVIGGVPHASTMNGSKTEEVFYVAEWTPSAYSSMDDQDFTFGDIVRLQPQAYARFERYLSYDVTAALNGATRTYRAVAFFGPPDDGGAPLFIDNIASRSGALNKFWDEHRMPAAPRPIGIPDVEAANGAAGRRAQTQDLPCEAGSQQRNFQGIVEHEHDMGYHGGNPCFKVSCTTDTRARSHTCDVTISGQLEQEFGSLTGLMTYHAVSAKVQTASSTDALESALHCSGTYGVGVISCILSCEATVSLTSGYEGGGGSGGVGVTVGGTGNSHEIMSSGYTQSGYCAAQLGLNGNCGTTINDATFVSDSESTLPCWDVSASPIIIDVDGDGYALTDLAHGVAFDLDRNGVPERLAWTAPDADDAFLVLDRNGNGYIDDGGELFGNFTDQTAVSNRNGFLALAEFDKPANGGNGDGVIDSRDAVFSRLRLWSDRNHNGISEPSEMRTLDSADISRLHLQFKLSKQVDEFGNFFRYRAKVDDEKGAKVNRWMWDVFFAH